jgi:hypothetical protein
LNFNSFFILIIPNIRSCFKCVFLLHLLQIEERLESVKMEVDGLEVSREFKVNLREGDNGRQGHEKGMHGVQLRTGKWVKHDSTAGKNAGANDLTVGEKSGTA